MAKIAYSNTKKFEQEWERGGSDWFNQIIKTIWAT